MKLWLKISLVCTAVLLLIVGICSTLIVFNSRERILELTVQDALKEQQTLQTSFSEMVSNYEQSIVDPFVKRSLINYCFNRYANEMSVLILNGATIRSDLIFDPATLLPAGGLDQQKYYLGTVGGRNILVTGSRFILSSDQYTIYSVWDISSLYGNIQQMVWQFAAISMTGILIGMALIMLLVWLYTKPLKSLGETAKRIAMGEYNERAHVDTKDEVGELAGDFNSMAKAVQENFDAIREMVQRQQLFIGGLTHEFKTPLTSIIGHTETLLYTSMPEDVAENSLYHIHEQCLWLERLTQKLLHLVVLQEDIELKQGRVQDLLESVRDNVAQTLNARGIRLEIRCECKALPMDFDLMQSLLINLVDNASKASSTGQTIRIAAYDRTIEVSDEGIGIPEQEISKITEPFYRVDKSRSKKLGGVGLGLALVQRIADAHHASIAIDSAPGQGTTVRVNFPENKSFTFS